MKINFNSAQLLGEGIVFRWESESRPGTFHFTFKLRHGGVVCTCEGWQFRGYCKHVMNVPLDTGSVTDIMREWNK
jgi:hypothetical protein